MKFVSIVLNDDERVIDQLIKTDSILVQTYKLDCEDVCLKDLLSNIEMAIDNTEIEKLCEKLNKIRGKYKKQE